MTRAKVRGSWPRRLAQRLPPVLARAAKRVAARPRYLRQRAAAAAGQREFGARYPHELLFVAGLPKSGTTWVEQMLCTFPGYRPVMIPEAIAYEMRHGGSHDFELPPDFIARFRHTLTVAKMHVHGSDRNHGLLETAGLPYLVVYRDLRDVGVSYVHYVRRTRWHPDHPDYRGLDVEQGLLRFARELLPPYRDWILSWRRYRAEPAYLEVRYESLLADAESAMSQVAAHFGLAATPEEIRRVVERNRFERYTGGRRPGSDSGDGFVRSGTSGDWRNHFTPAVERAFADVAGELMAELGYEREPGRPAPTGKEAGP